MSVAFASERGAFGLPAIIDNAARSIASARTAAEVLEARDMASMAYDMAKKAARIAKAKDACDTLIAAAHRAQADALLIESQARRRLADEYDAAQGRGEVTTRSDQNLLPDQKKVSVSDLGMTHKEIHQARQIRDAEERDPGIIERTVQAALDRGEEPTRAEVRRAVAPLSERLAAAAAADGHRFDEMADQRDFKKAKTLFRQLRPGAQRLFREFILAGGK